MGTTTKVSIGLSALCCLATAAFAGGPEMPMVDMNGFNIGLGAGYKTYYADNFYQVGYNSTNASYANVPAIVNQTVFGPLGEIGYTFAGDWWVGGIRGYYEYDNVSQNLLFGPSTNDFNGTTSLSSHLAAMLFGGVKLSDTSLAYLEAGYTALWGENTINPNLTNSASHSGAFENDFTLSGGIVGIGMRHYFADTHLYLDVSYDYAIYSDSSSSSTVSATGNAGVVGQLGNVEKISVNGVTATVNYLFNF